MKVKSRSVVALLLFVTIVITTAGCGGGGGGSGGSVSPELPIPLPEPEPEPSQTPSLASQAPIVDVDGSIHIGADVAPPRASLTAVDTVRGVGLSAGHVRDGLGMEEVLAYLTADAEFWARVYYPDGFIVRFGLTPPIVRVVEDATPDMISDTVRAVQLINASLPHDWRLRFSATLAPADVEGPDEGEILVRFLPYAEWPDDITVPGICEDVEGCGTWVANRYEAGIVTGEVHVAPERADGPFRLWLLVHEILHTLGRGHPDPERFPDTIMIPWLVEEPAHVLYQLDREALLAVYGRLEMGLTLPEDLATDLGPWDDTSLHIRGDINALEGAAFGVAYRNNLAQPWAYGPTPPTNLADNEELQGSASWAGVLMGFDRNTSHTVIGRADMSVELASLAGDLDFTGLQSWPFPSDAVHGTGALWGDGDLAYTIRVRGNTFVQTGGDEGIITGAFFGASHEGMGGTLERSDLAAAFGGSR